MAAFSLLIIMLVSKTNSIGMYAKATVTQLILFVSTSISSVLNLSPVSLNKIPAARGEESIELSCFLFMVFCWQQIVISCNSLFMHYYVINYFVAMFYSLIKNIEFKLSLALIIYQTSHVAQFIYLVTIFSFAGCIKT